MYQGPKGSNTIGSPTKQTKKDSEIPDQLKGSGRKYFSNIDHSQNLVERHSLELILSVLFFHMHKDISEFAGDSYTRQDISQLI